MGGGSWSPSEYTATTRSISSKAASEIYSRSLFNDFDPKNIKKRESKDSKDHPESNAIIIGLDVTGSMDPVLGYMAKEGLGTLMKEIYSRKPVPDPHVMCMGIGDVEWDRAPLQVTQFEADIRISKQMQNLWMEQGGGGNQYESYILPWYFAATKTEIDCFDKRAKKGYIFTIGDERITPKISAAHIKRVLGEDAQQDFTAKELHDLASEKYNIFHLMVEEGNAYKRDGVKVKESWHEVLGQNAILLSDHTKLAEVIVSTIQVNEGMDIEEVIASWDPEVGKTIKKAIHNFNPRR